MAMQSIKPNLELNLTFQVFCGVLLGIFTGIFLGNYTAVLRPVGQIYVMLMQSVVYPYIIASLLHGLGSLTPAIAKKLFKKNWFLYLFFVIVSFSLIGVLTLAIPKSQSSILGPLTVHPTFEGFLKRLIPDNLFTALVNNYMPAIIIFCLLFGSALQHYKSKEPIFEILNAVKSTSLKVWNWIILGSPYAAFALMAYTMGTISFLTFENIAIYLILFFIGCLVFIFWLLPGLIISFVPVRYKEIMHLLKGALLISIATSLSVAALPYIEVCANKLLARGKELNEKNDEIVTTISSISYPFGQIGNFFLYLFIIFAAYYFQHPLFLENMGNFFLIILTYFSSLGSPSTTVESVSFLASWADLPKTTAELYVGLFPITRYGQVPVSVMGMALIAIVGTFAYFNRLKIRKHFLIFCLLSTFLPLFLFVIFLTKFKFISPSELSLLNFRFPPELTQGVKVSMDPINIPSTLATPGDLQNIRKNKLLRVGYNEHMIPFVYFNKYHELVGYDVAYMYNLARVLGVELVFIHFDFPNLITDLNANKFDIAIGSIYVIPDRLLHVAYTQAYFSDQPAFIVKKDKIDDYKDVNAIKNKNLKIAVFDDPVMIPLAEENFSKSQLVIIPNMDVLVDYPEIDAALWTLEHTQAWAGAHPGYASVMPYGLKSEAPLLMAYMVRKQEQDFLWFLNYWLKIKESDGFQQEQYEHWILGKPVRNKDERWSIIHNVLHWV
ncbi:C4-dicarboxylic acid, orotate and citrate transporter [Legionella brunensis]|uniref:C4-dicarboxylic acid, orotate and citrate transporter n=2 Tax=Legionella brunensis TaxID=29422 RepID=A0A0W0SKA7_9GAMM|nr:C4-dicarboxylic acid, orotate and citrate transporter [Legionella brunensis]